MLRMYAQLRLKCCFGCQSIGYAYEQLLVLLKDILSYSRSGR